jgi:tetratricopeptide (TPR) repeat protein
MSAGGGYSARDAAEILGVSVREVRAYVRAAALHEDALTFQDVALLKRIVAMAADPRVARRVKRALRTLRTEIGDRPLADLGLVPVGAGVAVREHDALRSPGSRQLLLDLEAPREAREPEVTPLAERAAARQRALAAEQQRAHAERRGATVDDVFTHACELEQTNPGRAAELYLHVLAVAPDHVEARINLGRIHHDAGDLDEAEAQYRAALEIRPGDTTALFNLAVVLEDRDRFAQAIEIYRRVLDADPNCADAHFNLARICELTGDRAGALRHLRTYRKLTRGR